MNVNALITSVVSAVNPATQATLQISLGAISNPDASRTPKYLQPAIPVQAQVQFESGSLRQSEGLNLQGLDVTIFLNGDIRGLVRVKNKGGDLITIADGP